MPSNNDIFSYWMEQLRPVVDLSKVSDVSGFAGQLAKQVSFKDYQEFSYDSFLPTSLRSVFGTFQPPQRKTKIIKRYYQALTYKKNGQEAYGMECNASTLMYFLQSLGLIPPNITRKEFEYAFTTLLPYSDEKRMSKQRPITIGGNYPNNMYPWDNAPMAMPANLISSRVSKDALFGRNGVVGISQTNEALQQIGETITNFAATSINQEAFGFLKRFHEDIVVDKVYNKQDFMADLSEKLILGEIPDAYFQSGGVIYTKIKYTYPFSQSNNHFVVITNNYEDKFSIDSKTYYLYPADDSLWGKTCVLIPSFDEDINKIPAILKVQKYAPRMYAIGGLKLHSLADLAVGIKI